MLLSYLNITTNFSAPFHRWRNMPREELTYLNAQSQWVENLGLKSRELSPKSLAFTTGLYCLQTQVSFPTNWRWRKDAIHNCETNHKCSRINKTIYIWELNKEKLLNIIEGNETKSKYSQNHTTPGWKAQLLPWRGHFSSINI